MLVPSLVVQVQFQNGKATEDFNPLLKDMNKFFWENI